MNPSIFFGGYCLSSNLRVSLKVAKEGEEHQTFLMLSNMHFQLIFTNFGVYTWNVGKMLNIMSLLSFIVWVTFGIDCTLKMAFLWESTTISCHPNSLLIHRCQCTHNSSAGIFF